MALGENNDLRKLAMDPIHAVKDSVNDALEKAGYHFGCNLRFENEIFGEILCLVSIELSKRQAVT
jgi:hypothetical protein